MHAYIHLYIHLYIYIYLSDNGKLARLQYNEIAKVFFLVLPIFECDHYFEKCR